MKPLFYLSISAVTGLFLGVALERERNDSPPPPTGTSDGSRAPAAAVASGADRTVDAAVPVVPGRSEVETFAGMSLERQQGTLQRWITIRVNQRSFGEELTILRALKGLTSEQAVTLLEGMAALPGDKQNSAEFVRIALKERIAALDPKLALELGRKREDPQLRSAALMALMQENMARGLRALAQLPEKERGGWWELSVSSLLKPQGKMEELLGLLKEMPQIAKDSSVAIGWESGVGVLAAPLIAQDPQGGLAALRDAANQMLNAKGVPPGGDDAEGAASRQRAQVHLIMAMMERLREVSPETARQVFDALQEGEKNNYLVSQEASARLKETGIDSAIRFAERQGNEKFVKEAARGLWGALAAQDRTVALEWLESLPPGPFRDGALSSVFSQATLRHRGTGNPAESFQAGAELLSKKTQLDFYAQILAQNRFAPSEVIPTLPLSDADKQELRRRIAPVRSK
jgi:hypothetical protein